MSARKPRAWLEIGGARLVCIQASVVRNARQTADTFSALLSISDTARSGFDLDAWTDFDPQDASIVMADTDGGQRVMVMGRIDEPHVSLTNMTVSVSGRDKAASLIEKRRNAKFASQKVGEVVQRIAKDHGLTAEIKGADALVGKRFDPGQEASHLILNRTDFEALSTLAESVGFRWFVDGTRLRFEPAGTSTGSYDVFWRPSRPGQPAAANVLDVGLRRNMSASRPHRVRIKSWHQRSKRLFSGLAQVDGRGDPIEYQDHHNGRTQDQVDKLAKSRMKNAIRHELGVVVRGPGDLAVDVRQTLNLSGTGTIFDQAYQIDEVTFDLSWGEGLTMVVTASAAKAGRDPDSGSGRSGQNQAAVTGGSAAP